VTLHPYLAVHPRYERKTDGGLEKVLANLWSRKKIKKKVHAGREQEAKWEIPNNFSCDTFLIVSWLLSMNPKPFPLDWP